jgi:transposase
MPWKECNFMDERLRFVARLVDGEKMTDLCREFGISRKTGYKIFSRYKEFGIRGLEVLMKASSQTHQLSEGPCRRNRT